MMTEAIALGNGVARVCHSVHPELPIFALGCSAQEGQGDANSQCGAGEHYNKPHRPGVVPRAHPSPVVAPALRASRNTYPTDTHTTAEQLPHSGVFRKLAWLPPASAQSGAPRDTGVFFAVVWRRSTHA